MLRPAVSLLRGPGILGPLLAAALAACGSAPPPAPDVAPRPSAQPSEPEPDAEAEQASTLNVIAGSPTEILLDGKPIGTTPISGHKVAPGSHEVTFIDEARGNRTMMVTVEPGDAKTVQSDVVPPAVDMGNEEKKKQ
jgi:hypothetical protein